MSSKRIGGKLSSSVDFAKSLAPISSISKPFDFSMRVRRKEFQYFTVRRTFGCGCCRNNERPRVESQKLLGEKD